MTEQQKTWAQARDRLVRAVTSLGYPAELGELMAQQLKSPKAMERMTSYVVHVRPHTTEMLVDEMLAICADVDAWHEKKASQEAQARYNARLFYQRGIYEDEDE